MLRLGKFCRVAVAGAFALTILLNTGAASAAERPDVQPQTKGAFGDVGPETYQNKAGLDACTRALTNQSALSAWWTYSPFYVYGFYLGGVTATKQGCAHLDLATFNYGAGLGWAFMPLWYGPQVPQSCGATVAVDYISLNATTAYQQGVAEANAAYAAARAMNFGANSVITYDLEAEGHANATCKAAAQAFIKGWDYQMQYNTLYWGWLYGGVSAIFFTDFTPSAITYPPYTIWPWKPCCYTSVYGLTPQLSDGLWSLDQRYHQLSKPGTRTYGGVSASIDEDCADTKVISSNTLIPTQTNNNCSNY